MMSVGTPPTPDLLQTGRRTTGHETDEPVLSATFVERPLIAALFRLQHICKSYPLTVYDS
jgi:hypothetical protein